MPKDGWVQAVLTGALEVVALVQFLGSTDYAIVRHVTTELSVVQSRLWRVCSFHRNPFDRGTELRMCDNEVN